MNFNGTGAVSIRDSLNVSSITDNGTGRYTINFTSAFSDTNYSWVGTARMQYNNTSYYPLGVTSYLSDTKTTTSLKVVVKAGNGADDDSTEINIHVNGG